MVHCCCCCCCSYFRHSSCCCCCHRCCFPSSLLSLLLLLPLRCCCCWLMVLVSVTSYLPPSTLRLKINPHFQAGQSSRPPAGGFVAPGGRSAPGVAWRGVARSPQEPLFSILECIPSILITAQSRPACQPARRRAISLSLKFNFLYYFFFFIKSFCR